MEVPVSSLGPDTGNPDWGVWWFYLYLQANSGLIPDIKLRPLSSIAYLFQFINRYIT
jgi:hypothetical protein